MVVILIKRITLHIKIDKKAYNQYAAEFFIDDKPLSEILGIDRNSLAFIDNDINSFYYKKKQQSKSIVKDYIEQCIGKKNPFNQFNSNRLVLYRCHCGCDYCGVISCRLNIKENIVIWEDVRYENEDNDDAMKIKNINDISFEKKQYMSEFEKILQQNE